MDYVKVGARLTTSLALGNPHALHPSVFPQAAQPIVGVADSSSLVHVSLEFVEAFQPLCSLD